ncbi:MAG: O-antigen ligase family protein [Chthoniobacter sp.]|nr:O-antigen ligase family protein [Chthoniobacter sp.]
MRFISTKLPMFLFLAALVVIHCLIGGGRAVFSLPAFALLGLAGVLAFRRSGSAGSAGPLCLAGTGVLFSYLLGRAALSPVPYLSRADIFLMLGCLVIYLLTAFVFTTARPRLLVAGTLLALALVHAGVAAVQAYGGEDYMLFGFIRPTMGNRASGMFISPNHVAGFLEIAGVLGLSLTWWSVRKTAAKILLGYATACGYVALLLTQSRGGVLCAVFSLLAWGALAVRVSYLRNPRSLDRALLFGAIAAVLLLAIGGWLLAQHQELQERMATALSRDIRVANWQAALDQFRTAPVFGTGAGTHLYFGRLFRQPELQAMDPVHAHCDYLELLAEYGIVGAAGMLCFLAIHLRSGLRALRSTARALRGREGSASPKLALLIGALAAFAAMSAHSIVDFNLHIPANALTMAFLFGILAGPQSPDDALRESGLNSSWPVRARVALPLLGALLLLLSVLGWPGEYYGEIARLQLADEDYPEAIASATQSLRLDPGNPFVCFHLGEAERRQAELEEKYADRQRHRQAAEAAYARGLQLFPQDENLLIRRAQVLDQLRRFEEAEAAFQAALAADPKLNVLKSLYEKHLKLRGASDTDDAAAK